MLGGDYSLDTLSAGEGTIASTIGCWGYHSLDTMGVRGGGAL